MPVTAVRTAVPAGRARPSGPKVCVQTAHWYAFLRSVLRTGGAVLLIASGSLIPCSAPLSPACLPAATSASSHHTNHPPDAGRLEPRSARRSASPAALACPVGGVAQQVQPAGRVDSRSRGPGVEPQRLGLFG